MAKVVKVEWTATARNKLRKVYEFHAEFSEDFAFKLVIELIEKADAIIYTKQYQVDDINPKYRRLVVR